MENKQFIESELKAQFEFLFTVFEKLPKEKLVSGSPQKWSAIMQLDHLIKSTRAVNRGLVIPKFLFPLITGKLKRNAFSYIEIVEMYTKKLEAGAKATGGYLPNKKTINDLPKLIGEFNKEQLRMIENLKIWSEADLDKYVMPHPIIGKISVREMLFFTIYHIQHHTKSVQKLA